MDRQRISSGINKRMSTAFSLIMVLVLMLSALPTPTAQARTSDLFFAEYIEGSSNNKALEIYNGTGAAVDLAAGGYSIAMFSNGGTTASVTINLTGVVANKDVFVLAHASADSAILAQADQTNGAGWFNGDDAVVLRKGTTVIDVIGQIGYDPGSEWGTGLVSTADNTLRRKADICTGDTDGSNAFDPSVEFDGYAQNTYDGLGSHIANCDDPTVINEVLASTTGTDTEYIELYGEPGGSLAGLSLIYVESNNSAGPGTIDFRYDFLADAVLGTNGFYLIGTTSSLQSFYGVTPNIDIVPNSLENSSATVALVQTASLSGSSVSGSEVVLDAVGIVDATASTLYFSAPAIGPDGTFFPAGARRVVDGVDTDTAADWVIADFNLGPANTPTAGVSADVAPTVSATVPAAGAADVPVSSNISVSFSENVDVAAGAISIQCPVNTQVASNAAASNVGSVTIDPAADLPASTACAIVINASGVTDKDGVADALTGETTFNFTTGAGAVITPIHAIQGSGGTAASGTFTVEAIVVADYQTQGSGQLRGFFLQEEDADADADPATSEGIFIFCSSCPVPVSVGDKVRVSGASSEYFNMSQLSAAAADSITVLSSNNDLPTSASINLPIPGVPSGDLPAATAAINAYYETMEGMLVTFSDALSVSEYFELARYGQVILSEGGRPRTFTDANAPSASGLIDHEINLATRTVILDDTDNRQNRPVDTPNTAYYHPVPGLSSGNFFRGGDTIANLTGVLHWSYAGQTGTDAWRIRPVTEKYTYAFTPVNARPTLPEVSGRLKVTGYNVLNYFLTVDTTASDDNGFCGPTGAQDCRGADSAQELERQRTKLLAALSGLNADVVGLMELENTAGVEPLADIVAGLPGYAYINTGTIGGDAIKVGLIYKTATVQPVGDYAILDGSVDARFNDARNRPTLAQTFEEISTGARFTVAVNHLKSKGSGCGVGDDDTSTGQGNCNVTRTQAALALADWLASDPTGSGDADVLIIGDMNSYAKEDPIVALENAGYSNLLTAFGGAEAYSYVYDGQLGYLDHALANASLSSQVAGAVEWHINADEIPLFDYNDDVRDSGEADAFEEESDVFPLYSPDQYRTSDHDPVLIGLNLLPETPTVDAGGPYSANEGQTITLNASGADPQGGALSFAWDLDNDGTFETPGASVPFTVVDGPAGYPVSVQVSDAAGFTATASATVSGVNVAPNLGSINAPITPQAVNTVINASAFFTDPGVLDTHTASIDWGDGSVETTAVSETNGDGSVSGSHAYTAAGIYNVIITVTDKDGAADQEISAPVVVFDPNGGFVTVGGWFMSPAGAYHPDPSKTGKASIGFVAKYVKHSANPVGHMQFTLKSVNQVFDATSFDYLVMTSMTAMVRGSCTLNDEGNYAFLIIAHDGSPDTLHIKIWDPTTGEIIYDNDYDQPLGGGQIQVHR